MTKNEFVSLQLQYHQSFQSFKVFLMDSGICLHSNYHYWDKKYKTIDTPKELAPIMFMKAMKKESASPASANDMPSGTSLLFPKGLRAHFGPSSNDILVELLMKSLSSHVLP